VLPVFLETLKKHDDLPGWAGFFCFAEVLESVGNYQVWQ
jgi:hypothetical protein